MSQNLFTALAAAMLLIHATGAEAGITAIKAVQVPQTVLPNHMVNDVLIDFSGNLAEQQMVVRLTAGSLYQDALGSNGPPNSAFLPLAPTARYDSFVAIGGLQSDGPIPPASYPIQLLGPADEIEPIVIPEDTAVMHIAWAPGVGVEIPGGSEFVTARISLSKDAQGVFKYLGSTAPGSGDRLYRPGVIENGIISIVPEPASGLLLVVGMIAWLGLRRARR